MAVVLISFVGGRHAEAWLADTGAPFPLLVDDEQNVYRAYGLRRAGLSDWTPRVIGRYLKLIARGFRPKRVTGDPYQLGGDFVVDSSGIVRFAYPSRDATDRPSVEALLQAIYGMQSDF